MKTIIDLFRRLYRWLFPSPPASTADPCWEVVPAVENGETIGYLVRWSKPDEQGRYLWVGHYYAGKDVSLAWCKHAADRDAQRKNEQRKMPCEYRRSLAGEDA